MVLLQDLDHPPKPQCSLKLPNHMLDPKSDSEPCFNRLQAKLIFLDRLVSPSEFLSVVKSTTIYSVTDIKNFLTAFLSQPLHLISHRVLLVWFELSVSFCFHHHCCCLELRSITWFIGIMFLTYKSDHCHPAPFPQLLLPSPKHLPRLISVTQGIMEKLLHVLCQTFENIPIVFQFHFLRLSCCLHTLYTLGRLNQTLQTCHCL